MRPYQVEESLRYEFTDQELLVLSRQLAHERNTAVALDREKNQKVQEYKDRILKHEAEVTRLSLLVGNNFEYRWVPCDIHYNDPTSGQKTLYRTDSGELVKTAPMSDAERKEDLPIIDDDTRKTTATEKSETPENKGEEQNAPAVIPGNSLFPEADATAVAIMEKVADQVNAGALSAATDTSVTTAEVSRQRRSRKRNNVPAVPPVVDGKAAAAESQPEAD